jgi:HAMP domain-containing protein
MSLLVRINVALAMTFLLAAIAVGYACSIMLQANAKREVLQNAGLMLDSALATRAYTAEEILPLLNAQMNGEFLPQSIPFYAASQNFLRLHQRHPEYAYKEATLNPTNPRDRATDWEADLVQQFRNDAHTSEISGERETPMGRSLYLARPIRVEPECMGCHSLPASAPATLLARYGGNNGFGWQPNEIVGAQVVSVPFASATASADRIFRRIMTSIVVILAAALLVVNAVLYLVIVRPVRRIAAIADELSMGNLSAGEFPARSSPELGALVRSFNRLRTSLAKAMKMLEA